MRVKRYVADHPEVEYARARRIVLDQNEDLKKAWAPMPGDAPVVVDTASEEVRDRVRAFRANNPGVEYRDAMHKVLDADPALKKRYPSDAPAGPVIVEEPSARPDDRLLALLREIKAEFPGITHARSMEIAKKRDPALWRAYAQS